VVIQKIVFIFRDACIFWDNVIAAIYFKKEKNQITKIIAQKSMEYDVHCDSLLFCKFKMFHYKFKKSAAR